MVSIWESFRIQQEPQNSHHIHQSSPKFFSQKQRANWTPQLEETILVVLKKLECQISVHWEASVSLEIQRAVDCYGEV